MGNFIKIYFWQVISILFNFAAVFVVTPYISSNQSLYGIYAVVTSAYLFISYADFGFLSAAMKYAAESFAKKNMEDEIKVIGFAAMVFLIFIAIYSLGIIGVSISPKILVSDLNNESEINIARSLLIILAIFCPVFVIQRILQIIFGVRLKDYMFQRILIVSNLIKVLSAIFFFGAGKYLIVEYFLFSQLCTLSAVCVGVCLAKKSLKYDIKLLFKSIKLTKEQYQKTKKLAYTSVFLTLSWILYYELDTFVIAKFLGPTAVAIFAIALTIMSYFRTIFGVFFSPFIAKFNHFIGLENNEGLKQFFMKILVIFIPLTVFPVICVVFTVKSFIFTWVGPQYITSVTIAQTMLMCYLFSFITYPSGILIMAKERVKALYITSSLQPFIYWIGIILTYPILKLEAFSYFKFIAFFIEAIVYLIYINYYFKLKFWSFVKEIIMPSLPAIIFISIILFCIRDYMPLAHSKFNLMLYFAIIGAVIALGFVIYYLSSSIFKNFVNEIVSRIRNRNKITPNIASK